MTYDENYYKKVVDGFAYMCNITHYNVLTYEYAYNVIEGVRKATLNAVDSKNKRILELLEMAISDVSKLTSGNVAHNKRHINCLLYEIEALLNKAMDE